MASASRRIIGGGKNGIGIIGGASISRQHQRRRHRGWRRIIIINAHRHLCKWRSAAHRGGGIIAAWRR